MTQEIKIVLVGDGGVGKTAFIRKISVGDFLLDKYNSTLGVEVLGIDVPLENESITCKVWDTAGVEEFSGMKEGYYVQADACIIMADSSNKHTIDNMEKWEQGFRVVVPNAKIVKVFNKVDKIEGDYEIGDECYVSVKDNSRQELLEVIKRAIKK